ncbi:MAG: hypothetical protein WCG25_02735 [bacterium]
MLVLTINCFHVLVDIFTLRLFKLIIPRLFKLTLIRACKSLYNVTEFKCEFVIGNHGQIQSS